MTKRKIEDIPTVWSTSIAVSGAYAAASAARDVAAAILSIPTSRSTVISRKTITINEDGGFYDYGRGGNVTAYAGGGIALATGAYVPRIPQILSGTGGILWQEPVTGWEAYISGKPGMERRNLGVWADAGSRLGVPQWVLDIAKTRMRFADGGTIGTTAPAAMGGFPDAGMLGQIIGGQVRAALTGMSVQLDDGRTVGRLVDSYRLGYAGARR